MAIVPCTPIRVEVSHIKTTTATSAIALMPLNILPMMTGIIIVPVASIQVMMDSTH